MNAYADTNFFTRLYLFESEERAARIRGTGREGALPVTWLHRLELCNALQLHVFFGRAAGHPRVTAEQAGLAWAGFREESRGAGFLRAVTIPTDDLDRRFEDLSLRHTAKHGFRTYDLLHVASALLLECDAFWSFDVKASKLAALEGLRVSALSK